MRAVNLLPRDEPVRSFEAKRGVVALGGGGFALVSVALAALVLGAAGSATEQRNARDQLQAELLAVPAPTAEQAKAQDDPALVAEKAARIAALSTALGGRIAWDTVLRQVSQVLPTDVWLSGLTTAPAGRGGGTRLTLTGSTYSQDGVARFLSRVAVLPALSNVQLESSAVESAESGVVEFVILADVKPPGAEASS